ncbi:MAG: hypothetical protein JJT76_12880 [Clostridiaceae bacterium]|nr:hypothetical protein [Clostridiaceae bacterium]
MKNTAKNKEEKTSQLKTIEELAEGLKLPPWKLAGAKAAYKWGEGKEMTEKEFLEKVQSWCKGSIKGVKG